MRFMIYENEMIAIEALFATMRYINWHLHLHSSLFGLLCNKDYI